MRDKKVLIAYFSWGGNTEYIARKIHNISDRDMFKIKIII